MKNSMFAAAAAAVTFVTIAGSAGAQGYHERPSPEQIWCSMHRDRCMDGRYIREDRRDVYRDDRSIALEQERIRAEQRQIELDRLNRESAVRNERVNDSYGQRAANAQYQYIFGRRW